MCSPRAAAQDKCCGFGCVDPGRHTRQVIRPERAVGGIRADNRHIGHTVAELEPGHAMAELIYFSNHVVAQHERRPEA
jgi:hypothetical protein